jgi:hypothetical protein
MGVECALPWTTPPSPARPPKAKGGALLRGTVLTLVVLVFLFALWQIVKKL